MPRRKEKFRNKAKYTDKIQKQKDFKNRRKEFKKHVLSGGKSSSIIVKNLPFSVKTQDIKTHFQKFGDICDVKLPTKQNGKLTGNCFVHFNSEDAAETAINQCTGSNFKGRNIRVEWSMPLPENACPETKKNKKKKKKKNRDKECEDKFIKTEVKEEIEDYENETVENEQDSEDEETIHKNNFKNDDKHVRKLYSKGSSVHSQKSDAKKRGRIIIRNLSFKATEEKLMDHFKEFGAISEVKLLKKNDGKLVGCGFVQFDKKINAIRAILARSSKPFLGRPIVCDWAMPKDKYLKQESGTNKEAEEKEAFEDVIIKEEPRSDESDDEIETETELDSKKEEEEEDDDDDDNAHDDDSEIDDEIDESDGVDENSSFHRSKRAPGTGSPRECKKPRVISNDVSEGCTVFVKNIPFSATNEDLQKCVKQFGPVVYALICMDELTEHSKGTGFVKFKNKDDAESCLQASTLMIKDQNIEVLKALPRNDIKSMDERKKEKNVKDNRHLYLVKEGVILAGSPAAKDVSVADMEKRLKMERWKTQILRNLNMFVSNTRLVVYNVPPTWTDSQIWKLFKQHAGRGAVVTEARIMRDLRNVDASGVGKSKEFAFVRFSEHEHALRALRSINNNPHVFTKAKRPIVSFSIENKAILKIKEKRLQKSRIAIAEKQNESSGAGLKHMSSDHKSHHKHPKEKTEAEVNSYSGLEGQPGHKQMRPTFKLKNQAAVHLENVKQDKRKQKLQKKLKNKNKKYSEPQPKRKKIEETDSFSKLVDKYKTQLMSADSQKRWYE